MTNDKGILIQNIYYMLAYAFQVLRQDDYKEVAAEKFEHIHDLLAAILAKGISRQLKQGLHREYVSQNDILPTLRGKLDMPNTIRIRIQQKRALACEFDELSANNICNQILKTTAVILVREKSVATKQKQALKQALLLMDSIDEVNRSTIRWNKIKLFRNNSSYEMLLNICRFILEGMLQTTKDGLYRMAGFSDEHMERLYEKFILEYYRLHHPHLKAAPAQVKWDLDAETDPATVHFLPSMQTDVMLRHNDRTLIIDAKYYSHTMQSHFDSRTIHSANLYQIFTYVKNQEAAQIGSVSGLLLYAKTEEAIAPDFRFRLSGNQISVMTLDLNKPFGLIAKQLDDIAIQHFA